MNIWPKKRMKWLFIEECVKIASLISQPTRDCRLFIAKNRIPADKRGVKLPRDVQELSTAVTQRKCSTIGFQTFKCFTQLVHKTHRNTHIEREQENTVLSLSSHFNFWRQYKNYSVSKGLIINIMEKIAYTWKWSSLADFSEFLHHFLSDTNDLNAAFCVGMKENKCIQ